MADRYLLESGAPDGYQLEDGSGVLLLEQQHEEGGGDGGVGWADVALIAAAIALASDERSAYVAQLAAMQHQDELPIAAAAAATPGTSGHVVLLPIEGDRVVVYLDLPDELPVAAAPTIVDDAASVAALVWDDDEPSLPEIWTDDLPPRALDDTGAPDAVVWEDDEPALPEPDTEPLPIAAAAPFALADDVLLPQVLDPPDPTMVPLGGGRATEPPAAPFFLTDDAYLEPVLDEEEDDTVLLFMVQDGLPLMLEEDAYAAPLPWEDDELVSAAPALDELPVAVAPALSRDDDPYQAPTPELDDELVELAPAADEIPTPAAALGVVEESYEAPEPWPDDDVVIYPAALDEVVTPAAPLFVDEFWPEPVIYEPEPEYCGELDWLGMQDEPATGVIIPPEPPATGGGTPGGSGRWPWGKIRLEPVVRLEREEPPKPEPAKRPEPAKTVERLETAPAEPAFQSPLPLLSPLEAQQQREAFGPPDEEPPATPAVQPPAPPPPPAPVPAIDVELPEPFTVLDDDDEVILAFILSLED